MKTDDPRALAIALVFTIGSLLYAYRVFTGPRRPPSVSHSTVEVDRGLSWRAGKILAAKAERLRELGAVFERQPDEDERTQLMRSRITEIDVALAQIEADATWSWTDKEALLDSFHEERAG